MRFDKCKSIDSYKILLFIQWKTWNINLQSSLMGAFYNTVARSFERLCSWKQMHSTDFSTSAFMGLSLSSPWARLAALRSMERRTNEDQFSVWSSPWTTVRRSTSAFFTTYMVATHVAAISKAKKIILSGWPFQSLCLDTWNVSKIVQSIQIDHYWTNL